VYHLSKEGETKTKWLSKWSFGNKAAVGLLVVIPLVVGGMSYASLPIEFMPEADNPQVTVTVL
jgi:multidrug efflux pump subunit AcrB